MKHEPKNTVSVRKWCNRCKANTDHRVDGGRVSRVCLRCQERDELQRAAAKPLKPAAVQTSLFGGR